MPAALHQSMLRALTHVWVSTLACSWRLDVLSLQASLQGEYQRSMAAQEGEAQHAVTQEELQQRAEAVKARLPE